MGFVQATVAALLLVLTSGAALFKGVFEMAPGWQHQIQSRLNPGRLLDVTTAVHFVPPGSDKAVKYLTPVAGARPFLLRAVPLFLGGAGGHWREGQLEEYGVPSRGH